MTDGIHPAPSEFTAAQLATDPILQFFHYKHLPEKLRDTSSSFCFVALWIVDTLPRNAERTVALRKLLEAKDAAVRANLPAPKSEVERWKEARQVASSQVGEPREVGGHDEDRDGPVPFDV